jgi:lysophospholipase L1-like esterase
MALRPAGVRHGRWVAVAAVTLAGSCLLAAGLPAEAAVPAAAPPTSLAGAEYVALGDSYSAGYGIPPSSGEPIPACAQSSQDYPRQVAAALGLDLTDVTCSGAETVNIDQTPQTEFPDGGTGSAPLQDTALSASTKVVTLTIGGNDLGFSAIAQACFALSPQGPVVGNGGAPNCKSFLATSTQTQLNQVVKPALTRVLADITSKAPNAKVFVLEYPAIAPSNANVPAGGCFRSALVNNSIQPPYAVDSFPFTDVDVPFLHDLQGDLNTAVDAAATAAGAVVIPTFAASDSHSACAPTADQWVNGITVTNISLNPPSATTAPGALHPNAAGVAYLTTQVEAALAAAFPPGSTTSAPPTTTVPTTPVPVASGSTGPILAVTGAAHSVALTWTAVGLLLVGAGVTVAGRRRRAGARHR